MTPRVDGLPLDRVYLWHAALDLPRPRVDRLWRLLDSEERSRAGAFETAALRRRFVAARGIRRLLLGWLLDEPPDRLTFARGPHGKPRLARRDRAPQFNVSHSAELAAFAVAHPERRVGVDIEAVRPRLADPVTTRRLLSAAERRSLERLSPRLRTTAFFELWTRKEAVAKECGTGLASAPACTPRDVTLRSWRPARGFVGALASAGSSWRVGRFDRSNVPSGLQDLVVPVPRVEE